MIIIYSLIPNILMVVIITNNLEMLTSVIRAITILQFDTLIRPWWLRFPIHKLCVNVIIPVRIFFFRVDSELVSFVALLFSIAYNTLCSLCWITARQRQKTAIVLDALALRTWYCHFLWLHLSTINKRTSFQDNLKFNFPRRERVCKGTSVWIFPAGLDC